jgi:lipopolysaccharide/colanic/teichoic acid biosynthesis glycosyltransferase
MLLNRSSGIKGLSAFCLLALVTLSFWGWLFIWSRSISVDNIFNNWVALERYSFYNEFLLIGVFSRMDAKRFVHGPYREFVEAVRTTGRQAFMGLFAVFIVGFSLHDTFLSREFLFSYIPFLCITLLFSNYVLPNWLSQMVFGADRPERVALVGSVDQAAKIKPWIDRKRMIGLQAIGIVYPGAVPGNSSQVADPSLPVLGSLNELGDIVQQHSISHLIVMDLMIGSERLLQITQTCEGAAVRLLAVDNLDSYFNHNTMVFEDDGVRLIGLREEPLESPVNRIIKRTIDLAIAVPVVLLILPFITLFVYICQRLQSPGPVLYKQKRSGLLGRTFMIYKYRTMHVNNDNEARQAAKNDRRIFPLGVLMRKLNIDEFPQFINVVLGEMSVVGPRPHMLQHDELFTKVMKNYMVRRFVHPGITGWAQVRVFGGNHHRTRCPQPR